MESISAQKNQSLNPQKETIIYKNSPLLILIGIISILITGMVSFYLGKNLKITESIDRKNANIVSTPTRMPIPTMPIPVTSQAIPEETPDSFPIDNRCDRRGCLFEDKGNDAVIGFAELEGYYTTYDKKDWGDEDVTCDAMVIQDGNTALVNSLTSWVKKGNAINTLNDKGELVLNIDLSSITENYQQRIKSSTEMNPIKLDVIRILPQGRGAPACASFVDIIAVK
jgi:hypothetical protein